MIKRTAALLTFVTLVAVGAPLIGSPAPASGQGVLIGRVHEDFQPAKGKIFVLIIGNDAREGNPDRSRADAIHIAGINTKTMKGGILNFPRDSWVPIPGHGSGKMNEALYDGGPRLLAQTLEQQTGIRLDYWVMVGFQGFTRIIGDINGVEYKVPFPVHDPRGSGANLDRGRQRLGARNSLAFVRTRHSFPNGDIDRSTNQGKFLIAMLHKLRSSVHRDPAELMRWISTTRENARFDLSLGELFRLSLLTTQVKPGNVGNVTVPVSLGSVGAASVVFISPSARSLYQRFKQRGSL
ncbi:MAG: hypothetical protein GEU71_13290 [Actinobacteria bacterium]|nr:hypothetical protein [Actinomycetota bacterium]